MRADVLKQHFTLGCNHGHPSGAKHSIEATYDHSQKLKGILGHPLSLKWAGQYNLSDNLNLKTTWEAKQEHVIGFSASHTLNKNFRFVFSDQFNLNKAIWEPTQSNYNFGLLLEFTL